MTPSLMPMTLSRAERVILVTGSTDGIGRQTAVTLARDPNICVIVHGKSASKTNDVVQKIKEETGNRRVESIVADFANLNAVKHMAVELQERFPAIHTLVCNAGVLLPVKATSKDGYEMTMAVNHLAHFLLVSLMLDRIKASGTEQMHARIVAVSSLCHSWEEMDFEDFHCSTKNYEKYEQYSRSKLANMMFVYALDRRLKQERAFVDANVLEPGVVGMISPPMQFDIPQFRECKTLNDNCADTKLLRNGGFGGGSSLAQGARAPIYLACSEEVEGVSGQYFQADCASIGNAAMADVIEDQERLWTISNEMCRDAIGHFPMLK